MIVPAGTTPFRDEPVPQMDGSYRQRKNCMAAVAGCSIGRATVGRLRRSGAQIRSASGVTADRGLTMAETVAAVKKSTAGIVVSVALYGVEPRDLRAFADAGRYGHVLIDCSKTRYTSRRTNYYTGPHAVGFYDSRWVNQPAGKCLCELAGTSAGNADHLEYLIEDPGTTTARYKWWSAALVYRAAQGFSNGNGLYLVVFPDTEGVDRRAWRTGKIRATPYTSGTSLGAIVDGQMYHVLRTVNGGAYKRTDGTTAYGWHVVRLNDGRIAHIRGDKLK